MKYIVIFIIGILIGFYFGYIRSDNEAKVKAKVLFMQTEEGERKKLYEFMDSVHLATIGEYIDKKIEVEGEMLELATKYKQYTNEGMAVKILEIY